MFETTGKNKVNFWINLIVALSTGVGLLLLLNPGQQNKYRISNNDLIWESYEVDTLNAKSEFRLIDTSSFLIHPGVNEPVSFDLQFNFEGKIRVVLGILAWMDFESKEEGVVEYSILKNGELLYNQRISHEQDEIVFLNVTEEDQLKIIADKAGNVSKDLGCVTIERVFPENLYWMIFFSCLFTFTLFFLFQAGIYFQILFPAAVSYLFLYVGLGKAIYFQFYDLFIPTILFIMFIGIRLLICQLKRIWVKKLLYFLLHIFWLFIAILPLTFISYDLVFEKEIERDQVLAFFQTNYLEAFEYVNIETPTSIAWVCFSLLVLALLSTLFIPAQKKIKPKKVIFISVLLVVQGYLVMQNWDQLNFLHKVIPVYEEYLEEINEYQKNIDKFKDNAENVSASKKEKGETYIVVIGESLNKKHMSLYGYHRKTTPFLDSLNQAGGLDVYKNAIANHTHTMPVIGLALTQANQINGTSISEAVPLIPLLKKAGFKTYWLSNQVRYGIYDNLVSVIAESCDEVHFVNKNIGKIVVTNEHDFAVIDKFNRLSQENIDGNRVFFIHLMGSHGAYNERYPRKFKKYNGDLDVSEFGNQLPKYINYYDNSVLYNDWVMSQLITGLQRNNENPVSLVYFSDHSEEVKKGLGHNSGAFTFEMVKIPLVFWYNESYKRRYPSKVEAIKSHRDKYFSNDLTFELILGLSGVKTDAIHPPFDLTNANYVLLDKDVQTYHGERKISEAENADFHVSKNLKGILKNDQGLKYLPHRVNTKGMLYEVIEQGFNGLELDLVIDTNKGGETIFKIGHSEERFMTKNTFEDVLKWDTKNQLQKIWLDVKNLNPKNILAFINQLQQLDNRYGIKNRVIVESSIQSRVFEIVAKLGFHSSYYMPYTLLDLKSDNEKRKAARSIISQLNTQQVTAISFDEGLYDFVLKYMEPNLKPNIIFHTWDLSKEWDNPILMQQLESKFYWNNPRVETVLLRFKSPYYL